MSIKDLKIIKRVAQGFLHYYSNNMTIFTYLYKMYDSHDCHHSQ